MAPGELEEASLPGQMIPLPISGISSCFMQMISRSPIFTKVPLALVSKSTNLPWRFSILACFRETRGYLRTRSFSADRPMAITGWAGPMETIIGPWMMSSISDFLVAGWCSMANVISSSYPMYSKTLCIPQRPSAGHRPTKRVWSLCTLDRYWTVVSETRVRKGFAVVFKFMAQLTVSPDSQFPSRRTVLVLIRISKPKDWRSSHINSGREPIN